MLETPELTDIEVEAEAFAAGLAAEIADEPTNRFQGMPSDGDSVAAYAAMGRERWIGLHWPERLGGRGLTNLHTIVAEERFGYHWLPLSGYLLSVKTIGNALLRFAPAELQEQLLPRITAGEVLFCQGFSEPQAGSDLAAIRTVARRDGDRFIVNGNKIWTSSAQIANWIYLAVRTDTEASPRHRGISVLVVEMSTPGIEVREFPTLGGGTLCETFLRDVEIPAEQLVGAPDQGWRVVMATLDYERVTSEKVGVIARVLDELAPFAETAADLRSLDRLRGALAASRLHGRRATRLLAEGAPASAESAMAKLSIALLAQAVAETGVRMIGPSALIERGPGALLDGRLAALYRASAGSTISGGAAEIQRRVIARRGLGCPA